MSEKCGNTCGESERNKGKLSEMTRTLRQVLVSVAAIAALLAVAQSHAQTPEGESVIVVDKVVANPEKFKGTINVSGRVAKLGGKLGLFALSCEDACFSMPVRFSGTPPKAGSDLIVRGQVSKDANGHYVFSAQSIMPKK